MDLFQEMRQEMVQQQIIARGIKDERVLNALRKVPREFFVDPDTLSFAYEDSPLPIKEGQTISQPYIVAYMTQLSQIEPEDKVLEIGTGSGYSTAILSQLCNHVYSVERLAPLAEVADQRLRKLNYKNISIKVGDGTLGWEEYAPYDAILVTAGGPQAPPSLLKQLAIGGRLIMPLGSTQELQQLTRIVRKDNSNYSYQHLGAVRFVPLLGKEGWQNADLKH